MGPSVRDFPVWVKGNSLLRKGVTFYLTSHKNICGFHIFSSVMGTFDRGDKKARKSLCKRVSNVGDINLLKPTGYVMNQQV
jgi:hypothetical protein